MRSEWPRGATRAIQTTEDMFPSATASSCQLKWVVHVDVVLHSFFVFVPRGHARTVDAPDEAVTRTEIETSLPMGAVVSKRERRRDARTLRKAVQGGDLEAIRETSARSPSALRQRSLFKRRTLLMMAVKGRRTSSSTGMANTLVVSTLLWAAEENLASADEYATYLNAEDVFGNTALHIACKVRALSSVTVARM